jgi:hypothetical protein
MPANVVHNKEDEAAWERAKEATRKQYPDLSEDNDRFYKITMHIYQNMKGMHGKGGEVPPGVQEAVVRHVQKAALGKSLGTQYELACQCLRQYWAVQQAQRAGGRRFVVVREVLR